MDKHNRTPLMDCLYFDEPVTDEHPEAASLAQILAWKLIDANVNLNVRDANGRTPLMMAVQHGNRRTVEKLLTRKVQVTAKDSDGKSARDLAIDSGDQDMTKLLDMAINKNKS